MIFLNARKYVLIVEHIYAYFDVKISIYQLRFA